MEPLLASFALIFLAEMGDKTQFASMAFAAKFKASQVVLAISVSTVLNNALAVAAGSLISGVLSVSIIKTVSYALFILFGLWVLRGGDSKEDEAGGKLIINPFWTIAAFFFISEFGDKTQIAAMTIAMKYGAPVQVFAGASMGMICANLIGIGAGAAIGEKAPPYIIRWVSAGIFFVFGFAGLWIVFYERFGFVPALFYEAALIFLTAFLVFLIKRNRGKK